MLRNRDVFAAEYELGEGLAIATRHQRKLLRDAPPGQDTRTVVCRLIEEAAAYGALDSQDTIAACERRIGELTKQLAIKDAQVNELWKGLDVQQQSYDKGYAAGLAQQAEMTVTGS